MSLHPIFKFVDIPEDLVPVCIVEGCDNVSHYTDIKHNGRVFTHVCETHKVAMQERGLDRPNRPKCKQPDCFKLAQLSHVCKKTGKRYYKHTCDVHGKERWQINLLKNSETLNLEEIFGKIDSERSHYGDLLPFIPKGE